MNYNVMINWLMAAIGRKTVRTPFFVNGRQGLEIELSDEETVTLVGPFEGIDIQGVVAERVIKGINLTRNTINIEFEGGTRVVALLAKGK